MSLDLWETPKTGSINVPLQEFGGLIGRNTVFILNTGTDSTAAVFHFSNRFIYLVLLANNVDLDHHQTAPYGAV